MGGIPAQRAFRLLFAARSISSLGDRLVPVAAARDIARRHPSWRYLELAGVGHVPQIQAPAELASAMVEWLTETRQVSPAS